LRVNGGKQQRIEVLMNLRKEDYVATKYDLIVVGSGPGGSATAKVAAEKGLKVLLLERAKTAGDKNMSGSIFFKPIFEDVFPGMSKQNFVALEPMKILEGGLICDDGNYIGVMGKTPGQQNWVFIFRNESDRWLAEQAAKAGAELRTSCCVRDVIKEGDTIKGVIVDGGKRIEAPITIAADGLHSVVSRRSGLRGNWPIQKINLCVKYIYKMPQAVQRDRFGLQPGQGGGFGFYRMGPLVTACAILPYPPRDVIVVSFYMHRTAEMADARVNVHQTVQWWLKQPKIQAWLKGAEFVYFNAHSLGDAEWEGYQKKTYMNGLMVVGDAAGMANAFEGFGANCAVHAGRWAAEVAAEAIRKRDYSEKVLVEYQNKWTNSFITEDDVLRYQQDLYAW
jgi:flavin-dependent dehydrogenase